MALEKKFDFFATASKLAHILKTIPILQAK
jgi:hypothetical protein